MKKFIVLSLFMALSLCGCRIRDEHELVINVPQMKTEADVAKVRKALMPLRGVDMKSAVFDQSTQTVTVHFDSMVIANKNIEIAIAEAGYDANGISSVK